jgi:competence ComEA-like helix-hairpin-helix protein
MRSRFASSWKSLGLALGLALALGATRVEAEARIDLNAASVEELETLPGIGPSRARAIVEWRADGAFVEVEDLADVPGVGEALVDRLRDRIVVGRAPTGGTSGQARP